MTRFDRFAPSAARRAFGVLALVALIVAAFTAFEPRYASYGNLTSVARHMAANGLAALGLTFVVVVRRFDLSFPGIAAFAAVTIGYLIANDVNVYIAIGAGLAVGVAMGLANGFAVSYLELPDIVVTIGTGSIAAGMAFLYTGGQTIFQNFVKSGILNFNDVRIFRLSLSVYLMLAIYGLCWLALHRSRAGIAFYATGENAVAAYFSGIRTKAFVMAAFALSGAGGVLAAVLLIAESGNASTNSGLTLMMPAYAGVYLGAALLGGASVGATFCGTAVITILLDGFSLVGVPYYYSDGIVSLILLSGVVAFDDGSRQALAGFVQSIGLMTRKAGVH